MDCQKIGNLILKVRKIKGMTQKEVADQLNISDKTVSKWERGLGCPDITLIIPLSKVLDISVYALLGGEDMAEEKVNKVIENTLDLTTKKIKRQNFRDNIIITVGILIILVNLLVVAFIRFHYVVTLKPENVKIENLKIIEDFLVTNSCQFTLDTPDCETENGTYKSVANLEHDAKLPMWQVTSFSHGFEIDLENNKILVNVGGKEVNEKYINNYRLDKNYTKKSMIVNSLVYFIFINDLETIEFNFKDTAYLIEKKKIEAILASNNVSINNLLEKDNWNKYIIKKLKDDSFIKQLFL